jgi:ubiquinone/menaquinone biosynthesis C-methylase UbiE
LADTGQVSSTAAKFYDEFFVPALFGQWPPRLIAAAGLGPGMSVIDVACGTGVAALAALAAVSPGGSVVGVDLNPGMLAVARRKAPEVAWCEGAAEALPFGDATFDAVMSQFGLMFFSDKQAALGEMWRVLRPNGQLVVAVWSKLEDAPGYAAMTSLLSRLCGDVVADRLRSPYSLGDPDCLKALLVSAGITDPELRYVAGEARFESIRAWVECDVRGWTLADELDDAQLERLITEAETALRRFTTRDGSVSFAHPALFAIARK